MSKTSERIKVAMRCWPLTKKEQKKQAKEIVYADRKRKELIIKDPRDSNKKPVMFTYDYVYG